MWMPCVPGGSCVTSTSTRTPPEVGENVAVPIFWPVALTMSAWADWVTCADDFCGVVGVVRASAGGSAMMLLQSAMAKIAVWIFMVRTSLVWTGFIHL